MTYIGTVSKGKVALPPEANLPDGTKVRVETVEQSSAVASNGKQLRETLLKYAGKAQGLPRDAARNHDKYLYGTPEQ